MTDTTTAARETEDVAAIMAEYDSLIAEMDQAVAAEADPAKRPLLAGFAKAARWAREISQALIDAQAQVEFWKLKCAEADGLAEKAQAENERLRAALQNIAEWPLEHDRASDHEMRAFAHDALAGKEG